jgi:hypothetical protein
MGEIISFQKARARGALEALYAMMREGEINEVQYEYLLLDLLSEGIISEEECRFSGWALAYLLPEGHPRRRTVQFVFKNGGKPR